MMCIADKKPALQDPTVILSEYGADALRLYLVNSPVVHAETLRFKKEGVFAVVKDVFLPWYNAYRFLVQNVLRLEADRGERFLPSQVEPAASDCHLEGSASAPSIRPHLLLSAVLSDGLSCIRAGKEISSVHKVAALHV